MSANQAMERKNELLKRKIMFYVLKENQEGGLNGHESFLMQKMIHELHQNNYTMNSRD